MILERRLHLAGEAGISLASWRVASLGTMQSVASAITRLSDLAASPHISRLSAAFSAAGFELALVGGPVRDAFLGRTLNDLDFATNARPDQTLRLVKPISDAHWDIGRAFGTIGARIDGHTVEITTYRTDAYDGETRKPIVEFGDSLDEDLVRRDFTINAMALRLPEKVLVDPSGGMADLLGRRITTPGAPEASFGDDPLRMLRAARFTSQLGFTVAESTARAMHEMADRISIISVERIGDEVAKLLRTDSPRAGIELLVSSGLAALVLPELPELRLEIDEHHHHKDVYEHTLTVLEQAIELEKLRFDAEAQPDLVLRMAALLHDIGKPATKRTEPGGVVTFHHHDVVGAKLATRRLKALRFDNQFISDVSKLIELHLRFFGYTEGAWTDSAVRRYVRDAGPLLDRLNILVRADVTTRNRRKADRLGFAYDDLEQRIASLGAEEELAAIRPDLDGAQIMEILGLTPGPMVGEAYRFMLEVRLDEGILGVELATSRLREWWADRA